MSLTKFQINAVKQTAKSLKPLENKLAFIDKKRSEMLAKYLEEESKVHDEINSIHELIQNISGGKTLEEILTPEQVAITETPIVGDIDESPVEMIPVVSQKVDTFGGWAGEAVANAING